MSTPHQIKIIDNQNEGDVLYSFAENEHAQAYSMATKLEEMGLDISVVTPSITDNLCQSLGLTNEEELLYKKSLLEEIEHHEGSCCVSRK